MRIADEFGGILTAAKLSLKTGVSVSRATQILRSMQAKGIAEVTANQDGAISYKFFDLMGG